MAVSILGVRVDTTTYHDALERAHGFLLDGKQHTIFTPNPEMLVKAQGDEYFRSVLNSGDLNLCDGFGLWIATRLSFRARPKADEESSSQLSQTRFLPPVEMTTRVDRIPGVDFMVDLCRVAAEEGKSVYLLGSGSEEVVKRAGEELLKKFPGLIIAGYNKGLNVEEKIINDKTIKDSDTIESPIVYPLSFTDQLQLNEQENSSLISQINSSKADILFVAFGMGKQEKWIRENLNKMPSVRIAMGVGGSFDYISGIVPRAPLLMRRFGLEWLYRLVKQPQRIGRILNATIVFLWMILKSRKN